MKACKNAKTYQGFVYPRCNGGHPCGKCLKKHVEILRGKIFTLESRIKVLDGALESESAYVRKLVEAQKFREQQNVTKLTEGLSDFISKITGRRVKSINWTWE